MFGRKKKQSSQIPVVRELRVINDEFTRICAQAGQHQFRLKVLEHELNQFNGQLARLNDEAAMAGKLLQQRAEASAPAAEPAKPQPTVAPA